MFPGEKDGKKRGPSPQFTDEFFLCRQNDYLILVTPTGTAQLFCICEQEVPLEHS